MNASSTVHAVQVSGLVRRFGSVTALDHVNLSMEKGEFFSLLGPSGCGKTTLLRIIAGLDLPDEGSLLLHGQDALGIPAHLRPVNTVFQSYALFPHMTVAENIAFGLKMKKIIPAEREKRVRRVMEMVEIGALGDRQPGQLSGGQKQRVALARAIANEPEVLLLDEPLGALDLKLRKQLQAELHALQRRLGMTFIYVTHDQEEAMAMSDRLAVMNAGRVEQLGAPQEIYDRPRTRFVAEFLGACNVVDGTIQSRDTVQTPLGQWLVAGLANSSGKVTLTIRPENLLLAPVGPCANTLTGKIEDVVFGGSSTEYKVRVGPQLLKVLVANTSGKQPFAIGETLTVGFAADAVRVLES